MADLGELLARCAAATGPDRELDLSLMGLWNDIAPRLTLPVADAAPAWHTPAYTGSIDAAIGLVKRVLGEHWLLEIKEGFGFRCILWMLETDWDDQAVPVGHSAHSAPLAILAALLRALAQQKP